MTTDEMNALTKTARTLMNGILGHPISAATEATYAKIIERHYTRDEEGTPDGIVYPQPTRKRTWYQARAAFRRNIAGQVKAILKRADDCQRAGDRLGRANELDALPACLEMLGPEGRFGKKATFDPETERKENRGKRRTLKHFPDDWREKVFSAASPRMQRAIAALALSGCRPSELSKGVQISRTGDRITMTIKGSKTNDGHGQPERAITIERNEENAMFFACLDPGEISEDDGYVRVSLHRISRRLWPRHKNVVSAYNFRHQVASDIKSAGTDSSQIAMTLGHAVEKTQSMYGQALQGSGKSGIIAATGSREVKDNRRLPPGLREDLGEEETSRPK